MPTLNTRTALTTPDILDLVHVQDVSDTTDSASGTSKKVVLGDIQTLTNTNANAQNIYFAGDTGNAPWRIGSSNGSTGDFIADQVLYFVYNSEYDHTNTTWKTRDVVSLPVIRHGFETYWTDGGVHQMEWNLDVAPAGSGSPIFTKRLYGMDYYWDGASADNLAWQWRSNISPSIGGNWDMVLNATTLQVGNNFMANITSGSITIGNTVTTGSPVVNRVVRMNISGSTLYVLASTSAT